MDSLSYRPAVAIFTAKRVMEVMGPGGSCRGAQRHHGRDQHDPMRWEYLPRATSPHGTGDAQRGHQ